ncbi:tRNA dihydrouridine(20/20a) synthase DusA [Prochlorococcus sp. MIT 1306]|uniref:tRNA dihydrouridine(20/20a) synthase DusA n=1 Tax=Prochlorococcus sp. MIT 1306 TaxID=1799667 RepID=UPI0007B38B30|nr:tRNA dihydrouridine(20/20a) synthase DusA [Prochlorococcus sp. MIT 1306]KZR61170.1 putative tRNA-dihydrouridine synthase [Prochlorococcus sp. MIT 1306]
MIAPFTPQVDGAYRFSVAPMLDCTDRHFRVLMRQISRRALLYTEMLVAQALHHSNRLDHLLDFDIIEHPLSLQVGGDDPKMLAEAARLADAWGYDEINLNVGCPSSRAKAGNFGACLMAKPDQVARCVEAMAMASPLPVTVKHRLGIDDFDSDALLMSFVDRVSLAGATRFTVHARKAWLEGLDPKQNRTIPPLQHQRVTHLKQQRPQLTIEINGGLEHPADCLTALQTCDGAMVGRAAYAHPLRWQSMDELVYGEEPRSINASQVIGGLLPHAETHLSRGGRLWDLCRHLLQLVEGVPGAKSWRRDLGIKAQKADADLTVLQKAAQQLEDAGL